MTRASRRSGVFGNPDAGLDEGARPAARGIDQSGAADLAGAGADAGDGGAAHQHLQGLAVFQQPHAQAPGGGAIGVEDGVVMDDGIAMHQGARGPLAALQHGQAAQGLGGADELGPEAEAAQHVAHFCHAGHLHLFIEDPAIAGAPEEGVGAELIGQAGMLGLGRDGETGQLLRQLHGADAPDIASRPASAGEALLQNGDLALAEAGELDGERQAGDPAAHDDDIGAGGHDADSAAAESGKRGGAEQRPHGGKSDGAAGLGEAGQHLAMAELALAGAGARARAALQQFDIGEAIGDGGLGVAPAHILARAKEGIGREACRRPGGGRRLPGRLADDGQGDQRFALRQQDGRCAGQEGTLAGLHLQLIARLGEAEDEEVAGLQPGVVEARAGHAIAALGGEERRRGEVLYLRCR